MLKADLNNGRLWCSRRGTVFADRPYRYQLSGRVGAGASIIDQLTSRDVEASTDGARITATFGALNVQLRQEFNYSESGVEESITLENLNTEPVVFSDIGFGFAAGLSNRDNWRLCAIPFRVQLDGSRHDYPAVDLRDGNFHNAVYEEKSRPEIPLYEDGRLRSEAWSWWCGDEGLVIIKYNNADIELSVAAPLEADGEQVLRFGGAATCLYGEPTAGHHLAPGQAFTFGATFYMPVEGKIENAFTAYRDFLDARGHGFPSDYNPPVNWNELYDIGWYHSDANLLKENYTLAALRREAAKAKDCGCELLYLDPGWEVAEGTTLWDESRLGSVEDLVELLDREFGLTLGFRTVLRSYRDDWPRQYIVQHPGKPKEKLKWGDLTFWELCLCDDTFRKEKIERIQNIADKGIRFLMVDEMDWRGPCHDPDHSHDMPTTAVDHVRAVYDLCRELRRRCPQLIVECHDPVWPWFTSIYVPTYFQQAFGNAGAYDENWGFEYMWDCIEDLKSGKALALYYYNLACNIPLYLHITMAADNDACLFFWWAASTVRHLGVGGKHGHESVDPKEKLPHDPDKRFAAYKAQMKLYQKLKPYFVRGTFHGLDEHIHLHTLPDRVGGVLVVFNLSDTVQVIETRLTGEKIRANCELPVLGGVGEWEDPDFRIQCEVPAMSPAVVSIGDATGNL
jgi:hypothetical protein